MEWIKLNTDLFKDEKILLLSGDETICTWVRLLCLAGKMENDGVFLMREDRPYTIAQLSIIMGKGEKCVRSALNELESFGLIETINGVITIPNWCKHQGTSDARERYKQQARERQRRYKERQKIAVSNACADALLTHIDKDKDKEEEIDKEKYKKKNVTGRGKRGLNNTGFQAQEYTEADFGPDFYYDETRDFTNGETAGGMEEDRMGKAAVGAL